MKNLYLENKENNILTLISFRYKNRPWFVIPANHGHNFYVLKYSLKGIGKVKKKKVKVWKDIDEVVKASSLKDKEKDIFKIMIEIPKGEKALK